LLTTRGVAVLIAAVAAIAAGRILGLLDVFVAGVGLLVITMAAAAYVRLLRPTVTATRRVQPPRVHAGGSSRVELGLTNRSPRRSPVLRVRDPFDRGARWARFHVAPLAPGELARAAYRLPTEQRGVFDLGPLTVRLSDPFGLTRQTTEAAPRTHLTVYPRVDDVAPIPTARGDDPLAGSDHPRALAGSGGDFYGLRPYVRGDDLRRVHWPSTARTDDLMIRQDEMPWQGRATVVVDNRAATTDPDVFEAILSAAASIVVAGQRHGALLRLATTSGYDSGFASGRAHTDAILEALAEATTDGASMLRVLARLHVSGGGSLAIVTTTRVPADDLVAISGLRPRYGTATVVLFELGAGRLPAIPGARTVRVRHDRGFAAAWNATFAGTGPRTALAADGGSR
jgi:uncharacterized protein (DUF58 family)